MKRHLERFIDVIHGSDTERQSHYSSAILPGHFDGFVWFDHSRPVRALEVRQPHTALGSDEAWPFGL